MQKDRLQAHSTSVQERPWSVTVPSSEDRTKVHGNFTEEQLIEIQDRFESQVFAHRRVLSMGIGTDPVTQESRIVIGLFDHEAYPKTTEFLRAIFPPGTPIDFEKEEPLQAHAFTRTISPVVAGAMIRFNKHFCASLGLLHTKNGLKLGISAAHAVSSSGIWSKVTDGRCDVFQGDDGIHIGEVAFVQQNAPKGIDFALIKIQDETSIAQGTIDNDVPAWNRVLAENEKVPKGTIVQKVGFVTHTTKGKVYRSNTSCMVDIGKEKMIKFRKIVLVESHVGCFSIPGDSGGCCIATINGERLFIGTIIGGNYKYSAVGSPDPYRKLLS